MESEAWPSPLIALGAFPHAIGLFMMEWGKQEHALALVISLAEDKPYEVIRDQLLDGHISEFEKRLRASALLLPEDHHANLLMLRLADMHSELRIIRNDIVHGWWSGISPEGFILKRKERKKERSAEIVKLSDIWGYLTKLQRLGALTVDTERALKGLPPLIHPEHT